MNLVPLVKAEADAARTAIGDAPPEVLQQFVGWMVKSGEFSGKVAEEIRDFLEHIHRKEGE